MPPSGLPGSTFNASTGALNSQMILLQNFWQSQLNGIEQGDMDFKTFQLPLARIKKVMKTDEDVKVSHLTHFDILYSIYFFFR